MVVASSLPDSLERFYRFDAGNDFLCPELGVD